MKPERLRKHSENPTRKLVNDFGWDLAKIAARLKCRERSVANWYDGKAPLRVFQAQLEKLVKKEEERRG